MGKRGGNARKDVKNQKSDMPKGRFDIVPKNIEIEHIAAEMHQASMQKLAAHKRDFRGKWGHCPGRCAEEVRRNKAVGYENGLNRAARQ